MELEIFKNLVESLMIGLLIGLERGWHTRERDEGLRIAGLRTFGLISLLGGIGALLSLESSIMLLGFLFLGLALIMTKAYSRISASIEDFGVTSIIASLIAFGLGAMPFFGYSKLAAAAAVITTLLLGFKPTLHGWIRKLDRRELHSTMQLLLISVVMLPVLPDQGYGPGEVLNPYQIWWMVVLVAAISYAGYFAIRIGGVVYGPLLTGLFGGLVTSTVVTLNLSRLSNRHAGMENSLAAGMLAACATMFPRMLLLATVLNPGLFKVLLPPLAVMAIITFLAAFIMWRLAQVKKTEHKMELSNPFQLGMALKFGTMLALIMILARVLRDYAGKTGIYLLAAVSGVSNVDAITLSLGQMGSEEIMPSVAALALIIAAAVNSFFKAGISLVVGERALALRVGLPLTFAAIAGIGLTWRLAVH
ncbi:MAG: MgtC/SapB family protein [Desulfurivibrionaceae bacterium]